MLTPVRYKKATPETSHSTSVLQARTAPKGKPGDKAEQIKIPITDHERAHEAREGELKDHSVGVTGH